MDTRDRLWKQGRQTGAGVFPGFTLVETAGTASVILFALVVVASASRGTREHDRLTECQANLRAIGQASLVYAAEDPGELMIPVPVWQVLYDASGAIEWGGKSGRGQSYVPGDPAMSIFGTAAYRGPAHRPLNFYLYKGGFVDYKPIEGEANPGPGNENYLHDTQLDLDIYRCPSDTGYAGGGFLYTAPSARADRNERAFRDEGLTAYDHYGTSYVANTFWISGGLAGSQLSSISVYLQPLSQVPAPAHSIAYQEVPSRYLWMWGAWGGSGCEWAGFEQRLECRFCTVPGWHDQPFKFNVTFADGHAAMVQMQGCARPSPNLGLPNYPTGLCTEDGYECLRCVTIRGPGWQLDTLPAPPVLTPYFADKSEGVSSPTGTGPARGEP
ncbi:MAG: hypothetical protein V2A79_09550 [Planctomycetota bacterium]